MAQADHPADAAARRRPRPAHGQPARPGPQRAAGHGQGHAPVAAAPGLPALRDRGDRRQHRRRAVVAPGRTMVRPARRQVRPPGGLAGLQVRGAELRPAAPHRRTGRSHRRGGLRLPARTGIPAPVRPAVRRSLDRVRPVAAGLPRLGDRPVLPPPLLLLQVLLRRLPALAQRARRGDLRRHDGPDPPGRAGRARRLGRVVHHRGRGDLAAAAAGRLARAARGPDLGPWHHAADVRGAQRPAVPVVLRRDPDPADALAVNDARAARPGRIT